MAFDIHVTEILGIEDSQNPFIIKIQPVISLIPDIPRKGPITSGPLGAGLYESVRVPETAGDFLSRVFMVEIYVIPKEKCGYEPALKSALERLIPGAYQAEAFDCPYAGLRHRILGHLTS